MSENQTLDLKRVFIRGDEREVAERLVERLETDFGPMVVSEGSVWCYNKEDGLWKDVPEEMLIGLAQEFAGTPVFKGKAKNGHQILGALRGSYQQCKGVAKLTYLSLAYHDEDFFHHASYGIAFQNAFVTFEEGHPIARPHNPDNRARVGLPFAWNPNASNKPWREFLRNIFKGDADAEEKCMLLQEFLGACLLGKGAKMHKCLLLHGEGSNGKSLFVETIRKLFPEKSATAIDPRHWDNLRMLAKFKGTLINTCGEIGKDAITDSETFKAVVVGDTVDGMPIYQAPVTFRSRAGHIFSGNNLPTTKDHTEGFWRRFIVLKFNRQFKEGAADFIDADTLEEMLEGCLPGIAVWAAKGAARLDVQGVFTMPKSAEEAKDAWRAESDNVAIWKAEKTAGDPQKVTGSGGRGEKGAEKPFLPAAQLYKNYKLWCRNSGHMATSSTSFGRRLRGLGVEKKRTKTGAYYALALKKMDNTLH